MLFLWGDCDQVTTEILRHDRQNVGPLAADNSGSLASEDIKILEPIGLSVLLMVAQQGCGEFGSEERKFPQRSPTSIRIRKSEESIEEIPVLMSSLLAPLPGINAVVFYAEDIFHKAGTILSAYTCMVGFGLGQVIGSLLNMALIDRFGRRFLLILSSVLVIISLFLMSFYFVELRPRGELGWAPVVVMSVYTVAFAIGLGPVAWVMMGEILPIKCRSYGSVLATSVNWAGAFLVTNQWYNLQNAVTTAGAYALFGSMSLVFLIILVVKLPETKGRTLAEIEGYFVKLRRVDQSVESSVGYPPSDVSA